MPELKSTHKSFNIHKYDAESLHELEDNLVIEEGLEIRVKYKQQQYQIAITMRTPGHDEWLASGFLYAEGIIQDSDDVIAIDKIDPNVIVLELADNVILDTDKWQRKTLMSSSCGMCGKTSLDALNVHSQYLPWSSKVEINATSILRLNDVAKSQQNTFNITGGNHAVSLFDMDTKLLIQCEDVGRHNAMDKIVGYALTHRLLPLDKHVVLLSGRASYELVQKAMLAGIPLVVSVGAPSSLAVELAEEAGISLMGFLKTDKFNIYTNAQRVISPAL